MTRTSQYPLHTGSRQVAKSSPGEWIYQRLGERLGFSENLPSQTDESGKPTVESRVGEPVASKTANGHSPLNICDFPNTEHLKPKAIGEAETEPIGTTSNHPFWSVDRQEFVQAGSLEIGERLQTLSGDVKVVQQKLPRPGPQPVFNLEVHNEHVYFVGQDGVLVHNSEGYQAALGFHSLARISDSYSTTNYSIMRLFKRTTAFASAKVENSLHRFQRLLQGRGVSSPKILMGATDVNGMRSFIDGADHVHFNLDGFSRSSLGDALARGRAASVSGDILGYTNFELYHVLKNRDLSRTTFYRSGAVVDPRAFFGDLLDSL